MRDDNHRDVLILGAGLSGIGATRRLRQERPSSSIAVLERHHAIGGTWDLFTYPGIRSDSDMLTFGHNFRPWQGTRILDDGPSIKKYIAETAAEYGVDESIRFGRHVIRVRTRLSACASRPGAPHTRGARPIDTGVGVDSGTRRHRRIGAAIPGRLWTQPSSR